MKTKYPSMFGILVALMLVASFVIPANLVSPSAVEADPGICKWDVIYTPGSLPFKGDIQNTAGLGSEILDMAVGGDSGATIIWVVRGFIAALAGLPAPPAGTIRNQLSFSPNNGLTISGTPYWNLFRAGQAVAPRGVAWTGVEDVYLVAIAQDNPKYWVVVTDPSTAVPQAPVDVWATDDAGSTWQWTGAIPYPGALGVERIRTIDVSIAYAGDNRDIAVGTTDGVLAGNASNIYVIQSGGFGSWRAQLPVPPAARVNFVDFDDVKFSPTYNADSSLTVVWSDNAATYYNIAFRDLAQAQNVTRAWQTGGVNDPVLLVPPTCGIEVRDPLQPLFASASNAELNQACIALPNDFNGQAASLRRAYVSLDSFAAGAKATTGRDGIFRIDDTTVYMLMDTSQVVTRSIYTIAYFGTYASGKLLAGERRGFPCTATVPTWFTDSPTTCPIPCWYPALKPTTGAAAVALCPVTQLGPGGAIVGWRADGALAFVSTGSANAVFGPGWFAGFIAILVPSDESAFAISRNNGETWNQLALIDTGNAFTVPAPGAVAGGQLRWLTDVAVTPDCKTIYLATANFVNGLGCDEFDSVWRSSINNEVVAPLPPRGLGTDWERVLCRVTSPDCNNGIAQTDVALLRIVPYCADPSGQIVGWAVYDTASVWPNQGIAMWSPDYGDYWAAVNPRNSVQDFCFESATVMYFLAPNGLVQKMPYTGTAWANTLNSVSSVLPGMHTIAAYPEGKVLVGANNVWSTLYAASYSSNFNTDTPSFATISLPGVTQARGNVHVVFDTNFEDNNTIFIADDDLGLGPLGSNGSVYRNTPGGTYRWADTNMMAAICGAVGSMAPHQCGQYGIAVAFTGADNQCALYSAHTISLVAPITANSGVCRTLWPLNGMPKPGIIWDCLSAGLPVAPAPNVGVIFTRQPSSLKLCGCCDMDTDTTLWAIDNRVYSPFNGGWPATGLPPGQGQLWAFTDCLAKKGPALITEDKTLIGCDPVSGRAQEVNLCWEQLCVANAYDIEIAKADDFSIRIIDWVRAGNVPPDALGFAGWDALFLRPVDVLIPCAYFPAGGEVTGPAPGVGGIASAVAAWGNLECGHTYYWRVQVRECATTQIVRSPWSETRSFTIKAGLPVTTPYYGPQLLSPNNGCLGCPIAPASFSWSPFKETTKYHFTLSKTADMGTVVVEADVTGTTAYEYDGTLDYGTNYFWQVMALEPAPSDPSATFSFQTEAAPPEAPPAEKAPPTPVWVWVVIAIGAILVIVTLVLIFKTRRV